MRTSVVSSSRKAFGGKKVSKYDATVNLPEPEKVYACGGGDGTQQLVFPILAEAQAKQYTRTLTDSEVVLANREQEKRQTTLVDEVLEITVNVAREDFPSVSAWVPIRFVASASQAAWQQFMVDVRVALHLEFIDTIVDRKDNAPVHRTLRLRDKGKYFVRQRENSAILEVIESGKLPQQISWPITKGINAAKSALLDSAKADVQINERIDTIIHLPAIREQQREISMELLDAESASDIIEAIFDMMNTLDLPEKELKIALQQRAEEEAQMQRIEEERMKKLADAISSGTATSAQLMEMGSGGNINAATGNFKSEIRTKTHDKEVDIVNLHRMAFESLSRLLIRKPQKIKEIAKTSFPFIKATVEQFRDETDIVVLGLKFLNEINLFLVDFRKEAFILMLDCIQFYAPAEPSYRPKRLVRRRLTYMEQEEAEKEWNAQFEITEEELAQQALMESMKLEFAPREVGMGEEEEEEEAEMSNRKKKALLAAEKEAEAARLEEERLRKLREASEVVEVVEVDYSKKKKVVKVKKPWTGSVNWIGKLKKIVNEDDDLYENEGDNANGDGSGSGTIPKRNKRYVPPKFTLRPLPIVPGRTFRGFNKSERDLAVLQSFASLFKMVSTHYGHREVAFSLYIPEEISDVSLVYVGNPSILEYAIWIVDCLYSDGFLAEEEMENEGRTDEVTVDASMNVSITVALSMHAAASSSSSSSSSSSTTASSRTSPRAEGGEQEDVKSIDPATGLEVDAVSTVTQPSIDLDGTFIEPMPEVNFGDPNASYEEPFVLPDMSGRHGDGDSTNITNELALDPEAKERAKKERAKIRAGGGLVENPAMRSTLGDLAYLKRYKRRPRDQVIMFCAMISEHCDLRDSDKALGKKWLAVWDDASLAFRRIVKIGKGLSAS